MEKSFFLPGLATDEDRLVRIHEIVTSSQNALILDRLQAICAEVRRIKKFRTNKLNMLEKLALVHSEISEAVECVRDNEWDTTFEASGKPRGFAIEMADAIIRILDITGSLDIDIEKAIRDKLAFNTQRPPLHGKKNKRSA